MKQPLKKPYTAAGKGLRRVLEQVQRGEIDLLVGTQMIAKGHDFPRVTLVGVLCADLSLHFPDFRAAERTFQLLTQVAGRAGRGSESGRVLIQTYNPEHPAIVAARAHDYGAFCRDELRARGELGYPPFGVLAAVHIDGEDPQEVAKTAHRLFDARQRALRNSPSGVSLLGPVEAPLQKLKGRTRWLLLIKAKTRGPLRQVVEAVIADAATVPRTLRVAVDIDPLQMM